MLPNAVPVVELPPNSDGLLCAGAFDALLDVTPKENFGVLVAAEPFCVAPFVVAGAANENVGFEDDAPEVDG